MKYEKMQESKRLRKEQGLSIKQITKIVGVSQSSVSKWVRDIELTEDQKNKLLSQNPFLNNQHAGAKKRQQEAKIKRQQYQKLGKQKAAEKSWLHMMGCMLYWAEGAKTRNVIKFVNSDSSMMKLFLRFLREEMSVSKNEITLHINVHLNNGLTLEQVESYWLKELDLPKECLRKSTVSRLPRMSSGKKKNRLPYGVASVNVCDTSLIQHIYGAIQEYGNFINEKWLE